MLKRILLSLIAVISIITPFAPKSVHAAPEEYSYTYNLTNLYQNYPLVYLFTGLTQDVSYTWNIQLVGLDGSPLNIIGSITRTPSAADAGSTGFSFSNFPNVDSPFIVTDNFGKVLGRHFLAHDISSSAYWNTAGVNALLDRTEIRRLGALFSTTLVDNNGSAIDGLACCYDTMGQQDNTQYVSPAGNFLLVHYNIDPAVTESELDIRSLTDATLSFSTNMLEVVDYNLGDGYAFSTGLEYKDFIVLSTNGSCPFCDPVLAVAKFPTSSIPMYATLGNDYYECARINDASVTPVTHACEYLMGIDVSPDPMQMSITRSSSVVRVNTALPINFQLASGTIWNALADEDFFLTLGVPATGIPELISALTAAPFTNQRINIIPESAFTGVQAYWTMCPNSQYFQSTWLLCLSDTASFSVTDTTTVSFTDSVNDLLDFGGMNNEFSHIMLALIFYVGGFGVIFLLAKKMGQKVPSKAFDLIFIGISVLLILLGWFGIWTTVILVILCVLAVMHAITGGGSENEA